MKPNFYIQDTNKTGILRMVGYSVSKFPSGEVHVRLDKPHFASEVTISGSILSSDHLIELGLLVDVLRQANPKVLITLRMPYCAYSRQDRVCSPGEAFSLRFFASVINSMNFVEVLTEDNHSDVSTALLNNCTNKPSSELLRLYVDNWSSYDFFLSPDAGANKKVEACCSEYQVPLLRADKKRCLQTGKILETVVFTTAEEIKDKKILIIDDICQGGRTFIEIAKELKRIEPTCELHLAVTHGFMSNGMEELNKYFTGIFMNNDFRKNK